MRILFVFFLLIPILFFSCKEKETQVAVKKSIQRMVPLVLTQKFESATADLALNEDSLKLKGIKSYIATQVYEGSKKTKLYLHSLQKNAGQLKLAGLSGKDTIISERIVDVKNGIVSSVKKWHQINRKVIMKNFDNQNCHFQVEIEGNLSDTIKTIIKNNRVERVEYTNRGELELYSYVKEDIETVSYVKKNKDTVYQYMNIISNGKHTSTNFTKGLSHIYQYEYSNNDMLKQIRWKENQEKINATIRFEYDENGMLKSRSIKSGIKAFGNSETAYSFTK
jgi:hypothetical protein